MKHAVLIFAAALAGCSATPGWARDLGTRGITVNIVQAGTAKTDMQVPESSAVGIALERLAALARVAEPEQIAAAVAVLAGPDGSYVTGATLNVEGGQVT